MVDLNEIKSQLAKNNDHIQIDAVVALLQKPASELLTMSDRLMKQAAEIRQEANARADRLEQAAKFLRNTFDQSSRLVKGVSEDIKERIWQLHLEGNDPAAIAAQLGADPARVAASLKSLKKWRNNQHENRAE